MFCQVLCKLSLCGLCCVLSFILLASLDGDSSYVVCPMVAFVS